MKELEDWVLKFTSEDNEYGKQQRVANTKVLSIRYTAVIIHTNLVARLFVHYMAKRNREAKIMNV